MRAKFINEKFSEEGDPIRDMGIGTISSTTNINQLKRTPIEELEELYKRVHRQDKANVMVDGEEFNGLRQYEKTRFNNLVVKALNYIKSIDKRDKVRSQGYKSGDVIKCIYKGEWLMGYAQFSKRGIIKTDGHGRISVKTLTGIMKIPLSEAVLATPKEQKEFDKEFFNKRKKQLELQMDIHKKWVPERYKEFKEEYDELMKTKKVRI